MKKFFLYTFFLNFSIFPLNQVIQVVLHPKLHALYGKHKENRIHERKKMFPRIKKEEIKRKRRQVANIAAVYEELN